MAARADTRIWTAAALAAAAPAVLVVCAVIWRSPYPITEAVALFEDVAQYPMTRFLVPELAYYRPLYHLTIGALWHNAGSLAAALALIKLVHIAAILVLVVAVVGHLRPARMLDAAAALVAVAVIVGSPGFRDNLELPLLYTIVGMPLIVLVWILLQRPPRWWHGPVIVAMTLAAIGFKEHGLVIVAVALAAWWSGAPGARGVTAALAVTAVGYVAARLYWRGEWAMFEQSIGFGFSELEPNEAEARFGAFPYGVYAYNSASTMANVLFAEPTRGVFHIARAWVHGPLRSWQLINLGSSAALTAIIAWWGARELRRARAHGWSAESRLCLALLVALFASGVLSFNYSRDRLGGMAVPFYAMAAYFALRALAERVVALPRRQAAAIAVLLLLLAAGWQTRAIGTVEHVRARAWLNHEEWFVLLHDRRAEFAARPVYLRIMEAMVPQGRDARDVPRRMRLPDSLAMAVLEP